MKEFRGSFPDNFFWGTSVSAYQTEGNNTRSDWWEYEQAGRIGDDVKSGKAANHYELYERDFDLVQSLNNNAFRFSIEWARVEPHSGQFDMTEIEYYRSYILSLRRRGIEPVVTLWHFSLPSWFLDRGGWLNKNAVRYFTRYVKFITENLLLETDVKFVVTMNEPMIYATKSYYASEWPPQEKSIIKTVKVVRALVRAHRSAFGAISAIEKKMRVGIAKNNIYFEPFKNTAINKFLVFLAGYYWNRYFLNKTKKHCHFIGLNYYMHNRIGFSWRRIFSPRTMMNRNAKEEVSDMGWEIYPSGIYYALMELKRYKKPIFILENGVADEEDKLRSAFLMEHLKYVWKAIRDGADVRGYFYWSLIDNYEWAAGFKPRFGLFEVDYDTFERRPRVSARVYADICRQNKVV